MVKKTNSYFFFDDSTLWVIKLSIEISGGCRLMHALHQILHRCSFLRRLPAAVRWSVAMVGCSGSALLHSHKTSSRLCSLPSPSALESVRAWGRRRHRHPTTDSAIVSLPRWTSPRLTFLFLDVQPLRSEDAKLNNISRSKWCQFHNWCNLHCCLLREI